MLIFPHFRDGGTGLLGQSKISFFAAVAALPIISVLSNGPRIKRDAGPRVQTHV
jgi:hypothetical protein